MTDTPLRPHRHWGRTERVQDRAAVAGKVARIRLYAPIDPEGGEWGVSAGEFAAMLDQLPAAVTEIRLHVNSPGGDVFDGLAIANTLREHPARVVAVVDGIAASAASFVAVAADETVMSRNAQLMIHDASALAIGNADTMHKAADMLDKVSDNLARLYAAAAGGSADEWRDAMRAESWYSDEEAVAAGLAQRVAEPEATEGAEKVEARWDLSMYRHAGRADAPAPSMRTTRLPAASAGGPTPTEGGSAVAFTPEQITDMRRKLGVAEDADEATILAALSEALDEQAGPTPTAPAAPTQPVATTQPAPAAPAAATPGTMVIDSSAWEEREARIKRLEAADAKRRREERDHVVAEAVRAGKFPQVRAEHWTRLWDADPEGTRQVIDGLAANVVPVSELGHAGIDDSLDDEFAHIFPPALKGA